MIKKIVIGICCFSLGGLILFVSPMKNTSDSKKKDFIVIGHRGAGGLAPENTLTSIKKAMELKVDLLEIDVQRSKDSVVFVLHDNSINRTTTGKGKAIELDYADIKKENIRIDDKIFEDEYVPTLEEVIQLINGKTKLLIEIKKDMITTHILKNKSLI